MRADIIYWAAEKLVSPSQGGNDVFELWILLEEYFLERSRSSLLTLIKELCSGLLAGSFPMDGRGVCLRHALTLRSSYCGKGT